MVVGTKYYSDSSAYTHLIISKFDAVLKTTGSTGYDITLEFRIVMGPGSADSSNNGNIMSLLLGGLSLKSGYSHTMQRSPDNVNWTTISSGNEKFTIKRINTVADRVYESQTYWFKLKLYGVPYSIVGSKSVSFKTGDYYTEAQRNPLSWGLVKSTTSAKTFPAATVSTAPRTLRIDALTTQKFDAANIPANTDLTWVAPLTATYAIERYKIYTYKNDVLLEATYVTAPTLSYVLPIVAMLAGETRKYYISAINMYDLESAKSEYVTLQRSAVTDIIYVRSNVDRWESGLPYVRVAGVWKPATEVKVRTGADTWKTGVK